METMETTQIGSNKKKKIETNALKNGGKKESNKWSENRAIEKMKGRSTINSGTKHTHKHNHGEIIRRAIRTSTS